VAGFIDLFRAFILFFLHILVEGNAGESLGFILSRPQYI
jgi:hypothetical protein